MIGWSLAATGVTRNGVLKTVLWIECPPHLQKKTVSFSLMSSSNDLTLPREKFPSTIAHSPKNLCSSVYRACTVTSLKVQFIRQDFPTKFAIYPLDKGDNLYTSPVIERLLCTFIHNEFWDFLPRFTACPGASNLNRLPELAHLWREYQ